MYTVGTPLFGEGAPKEELEDLNVTFGKTMWRGKHSIVTASASASECFEKFNCYCVRGIAMRASIAVSGAVKAIV